MKPISTVGEPVVHGAGVFGTQGMGVRTPIAADVADATVGFAREVHMPKGMMLTMGVWSMIVAAGTFSHVTRFVGRTTRLLGASPKLHIMLAPITTC
jgi:hypothetical protein